MSRHDTRRWKRFERLCRPYAAKLSTWAATQPNPPADPVEAARRFFAQTGTMPPVPWDVLPHVMKLNLPYAAPTEGLPVPQFKPPTKE